MSGDFLENVFNMYGASREKLLEILAVEIYLSPISSVSGQGSSVDVYLMHSDFFRRPLFDAIRALLWISGA